MKENLYRTHQSTLINAYSTLYTRGYICLDCNIIKKDATLISIVKMNRKNKTNIKKITKLCLNYLFPFQ